MTRVEMKMRGPRRRKAPFGLDFLPSFPGRPLTLLAKGVCSADFAAAAPPEVTEMGLAVAFSWAERFWLACSDLMLVGRVALVLASSRQERLGSLRARLPSVSYLAISMIIYEYEG